MSVIPSPAGGKLRRILLVEDEPALREQVKFLLEQEGYEICEAEDGLAAISLIESFRPELIIADVRMPRMDGFELCASVRAKKSHRGIPFVFLTSREAKEDRLRGRRLGADDYVTKPFDVDELLAVVESRLRRTDEVQGDAEERFSKRVTRSLSHELKTPLTVIQGVAALLHSEDCLDDTHRRGLIRLVIENGALLNRHVENLIQLKGAETIDPHAPIERSSLDLASLVKEVILAFEPAAKRKQIRISACIEPGLDSIRAQRAGITVLIVNIIDNAVKFTPDGGSVEVSARRLGGEFELRIADTGIGISAEHQRVLFRDFYREEIEAHTLPGTGIGLSICRRIALLHGGTIDVASCKGQGTTVTVRLPVN